jgi:hypothetical protein
MQPKPWNIHVIDQLSSIQGNQQHPQPLCMCRLDSRNAPGLKELPQAFVSERLNHATMIACCASRNKAEILQGINAHAVPRKGASPLRVGTIAEGKYKVSKRLPRRKKWKPLKSGY